MITDCLAGMLGEESDRDWRSLGALCNRRFWQTRGTLISADCSCGGFDEQCFCIIRY